LFSIIDIFAMPLSIFFRLFRDIISIFFIFADYCH